MIVFSDLQILHIYKYLHLNLAFRQLEQFAISSNQNIVELWESLEYIHTEKLSSKLLLLKQFSIALKKYTEKPT